MADKFEAKVNIGADASELEEALKTVSEAFDKTKKKGKETAVSISSDWKELKTSFSEIAEPLKLAQTMLEKLQKASVKFGDETSAAFKKSLVSANENNNKIVASVNLMVDAFNKLGRAKDGIETRAGKEAGKEFDKQVDVLNELISKQEGHYKAISKISEGMGKAGKETEKYAQSAGAFLSSVKDKVEGISTSIDKLSTKTNVVKNITVKTRKEAVEGEPIEDEAAIKAAYTKIGEQTEKQIVALHKKLNDGIAKIWKDTALEPQKQQAKIDKLIADIKLKEKTVLIEASVQLKAVRAGDVSKTLNEVKAAIQETVNAETAVSSAKINEFNNKLKENAAQNKMRIKEYGQIEKEVIAQLVGIAETAKAKIAEINNSSIFSQKEKLAAITQAVKAYDAELQKVKLSAGVKFASISLGGNVSDDAKKQANASKAAYLAAAIDTKTGVLAAASSTKAGLQQIGGQTQSFFTNLGHRIVATMTSLLVSFIVYRAARMISAFARASVDAFTQANASARQLQDTLMTRGGIDLPTALGMTELMDDLSLTTGFIKKDLNQAMTQLVIRFGDGKTALQAFEVAMDRSSKLGIPLSEAMQTTSIAALGSLKALRQFGIQTNKDLQGNLLTPLELLAQMAEKVKGGLETAIGSPLGQLQRATAAWNEFKTAIGSLFIKVIGPLSEFFTFIVNGISKSIFGTEMIGSAVVLTKDQIVKAIAQIIDILAIAAGIISGIMIGIGIFTGDVKSLIGGVVLLATSTATLISLNNKLQQFASSDTDPLKAYRESMVELRKSYADFIGGIGDGADEATDSASKFVAAWEPLQLLSGNLPALSRFVGNLASGFVMTQRQETQETLDVNVRYWADFKMEEYQKSGGFTPGSTAAVSAADKNIIYLSPEEISERITKKILSSIKIGRTTNISHGTNMWNPLQGRPF
jgi:hypothetical protein